MELEELHLPEDIIHRIMFHLSPKQSAKASLFCKAWLNGWRTYPELNFHYHYFDKEHCCRFDKEGNCSSCKRDQQRFWNYMEGIMAKYQEQGGHRHHDHHIRVFSFDMSHRHAIHRWAFHGNQTDDWSSFLNKQLQVALEKGVKVVWVIGKNDLFVPESVMRAQALTSVDIGLDSPQLSRINPMHLMKPQSKNDRRSAKQEKRSASLFHQTLLFEFYFWRENIGSKWKWELVDSLMCTEVEEQR